MPVPNAPVAAVTWQVTVAVGAPIASAPSCLQLGTKVNGQNGLSYLHVAQANAAVACVA
jgi:hypothetical protein